MSLFARFIAVNKRLSQATEARLPPMFRRHIQTLYKYQAANLINRPPGRGHVPCVSRQVRALFVDEPRIAKLAGPSPGRCPSPRMAGRRQLWVLGILSSLLFLGSARIAGAQWAHQYKI